MSLIGFNFDATISRYYFDYDKKNFSTFIGNGLFVSLASALPLAIVIALINSITDNFFEFPSNWLWFVLMFSLSSKIIEIQLSLWRVQSRATAYGVFRILRTFLEIGASVLIITLAASNWKGRVIGQLIAAFLFGVLGFVYLFKVSRGVFANKKTIREIIIFGWPLIPHELGAMVIVFSDRLMLMEMVGVDAAGIYSVGYQIGLVIGLLQNSFNQAWVPWFYKKLFDGKFEDKLSIVKITYLYNLGMLVLVAGLIVSVPFIFHFLGREFEEASKFVLWIGLGFAFNGMYKMIVNYLFFLKKTYLVGAITITTAIINIMLTFVFIKAFGAVGAAYGTASALFIQFILTWIVVIKTYEMPWLLNYRH